MKRRNFLKTLLAAPSIPLVAKAVEAEPVPPHLPCPVHTIDALTEVPRLDIKNYPYEAWGATYPDMRCGLASTFTHATAATNGDIYEWHGYKADDND